MDLVQNTYTNGLGQILSYVNVKDIDTPTPTCDLETPILQDDNNIMLNLSLYQFYRDSLAKYKKDCGVDNDIQTFITKVNYKKYINGTLVEDVEKMSNKPFTTNNRNYHILNNFLNKSVLYKIYSFVNLPHDFNSKIAVMTDLLSPVSTEIISSQNYSEVCEFRIFGFFYFVNFTSMLSIGFFSKFFELDEEYDDTDDFANMKEVEEFNENKIYKIYMYNL